ncbi:MAG: hypothetical protein OEQ53_14710 [Saprospiraceae bacterium]|nr:hypothetical protein [Saprospiraceae bacterium]
MSSLEAQVSEVEYGKNRIQFHDDFDQWLLYESQNFITYWYGKARNHGVSTVKLAEKDHDEILDIIEHRINDKIEIIVFSDLSDLKQSNIGNDETFITRVGKTKIEGNRIFVYFDGDHEQLRIQIRKGIAEVFLNSMFFGSNLQEIVQNSVSGNVPSWFQSGLVNYIGSFWSVENDNELRNIFLHEKKTSFKRLHNIYPGIVGQSLWYYIGMTYGRSEISNLLYLTRINRSIEDAFLYVFGVQFEDLTEKWEKYFTARYNKEQSLFTPTDSGAPLPFKRKKRVPVSQVRYNAAGNLLAIVDNQISKTRIMIRDQESGKGLKLFKHGYRNNIQQTDYNYPMVAWHPQDDILYIIYEYRDKITLRIENINTGEINEQILPERYERVYAMDVMSERELVFSALSEGAVDLFYYTTNTRQSTQLTDDIYDDLDIRMSMIDETQGILFSSNRPDAKEQIQTVDTTLPFYTFNVFFLALEDEAPVLYQLTHEEKTNLRQPAGAGDNQITYLSGYRGIQNRVVSNVEAYIDDLETKVTFADSSERIVANAELDSYADSLIIAREQLTSKKYKSQRVAETNLLQNILLYDINLHRQKATESHRIRDDYFLFERSLYPQIATAPGSSVHFQILDQSQPTDIPRRTNRTDETRPAEEVIRSSGDDNVYRFQSEYGDMEGSTVDEMLEELANENKLVSTDVLENQLDLNIQKTPINRLRIVPYQLKFKMHSLSTTMDNSQLFGGLDSYAGFKREFEPTPLGILVKANFKDLFEDYVFEGGVRIPTSFNGAEYFLVFDDKKNRLDKRYAVYRKSLLENQSSNGFEGQRSRTTVLLGQFGVRYPLDVYNSVRATATIRQDKITFLASDQNSLNSPDVEDQRVGLRLEYVFDNSLDIDINIRSGTRFKVYTEVLKKFDLSVDPLDFSFSQGFMTVVGTDARHYLNFAKHSVLAGRFAASTSFGSERILYFLGGVDNWLIPVFNQEIPQPTTGNFAYRTISPNLRGFDYNIRNGSTFALFNAELRIPFLKYLSRRPIKISFLRHLQVVGFADVGAAWEGVSPFDEDNPINILNLENPPTVRLKVNYYRDPLVVGYGVGVRTMLFGYFLRLDYAWGLETRIVQKPKLHFALGVDF